MSRQQSPEIKFHCVDDCIREGCPSHTLVVEINHTVNLYTVYVDGKPRYDADANQFAAMLKAVKAMQKVEQPSQPCDPHEERDAIERLLICALWVGADLSYDEAKRMVCEPSTHGGSEAPEQIEQSPPKEKENI